MTQRGPGPVARTRAELEYRGLADGGMIYDPVTRRIHHLNRTAALIWQLCQQGYTADAALQRLCDDFDVDPDRARRDLNAMLTEFGAARLLQE